MFEEQSTINTDIDPRTGLLVGSVEEDEVIQSFAETEALATSFNAPVKEVLPMKTTILTGMNLDAPVNKAVRDTIEITKSAVKVGINQSKANVLWEEARVTGNTDKMLEAIEIAKENEKLQAGLPEDIQKMWTWNNAVNTIVTMTGQMAHQLPSQVSAIKEEIFDEGKLMAMFKVLTPQAAVKTTKDIFVAKTDYDRVQARGEIFQRLTLNEIDPEIGSKVAELFGNVAGSVDSIGELVNVVSGGSSGLSKGVVRKLTEFGLGNVGEAGTEGFQEIVGNVALLYALNIQAEKEGKDPIPYAFEKIFEGSGEAMYAGGIASLGLGGASAGTTASFKYSAEAITNIRNKRKTRQLKAKIIKETEDIKARKQELVVFEEAPVTAAVGDIVPAAPIQPEETREAALESGVINTKITEADLDNATITDDTRATAASLLGITEDSISQKSMQFEDTLREILDTTEEADAVMTILEAAANSVGMSLDNYIDSTGLSLVNKTDINNKGVKGTIDIASVAGMTKSIITAYQAADVSTMVHELAHHFRVWVPNEQLRTIEKWAGVNKDGVWSTAAEERFARGFERYLATGKAPTKELHTAFGQFKQWILDIYKGIVGSSIDIELSPEVTKVFDNLLSEEANLRFNLGEANRTLLQREEVSKAIDAELDITEQAQIKAKDLSIEQRNLKDVENSLREMQGMFDRGDKLGYAKARNDLKALLKRRRKASKTIKRHKRVRKETLNKLSKAVKISKSKKKVATISSPIATAVSNLLKAFNEVSKIKDAKAFVKAIDEGTINKEEMDSDIFTYKARYARAVANRSKKGLRELESLNKEIQQLISFGKATSPAMQALLRANQIINSSWNDVTSFTKEEVRSRTQRGSEDAHRRLKEQRKGVAERIKRSTLGKQWIHGLEGLIRLATSYSSSTFSSALYKAFDFYDARQAQLNELRELHVKHNLLYDEAYKTNEWSRNSLRNKDLKSDIDVGLKSGFINRSQLRQYWMYMQDPNPDTYRLLEYNGVTPEIRRNIEKQMTDADKLYANGLIAYFNSDTVYNEVNSVYTRLYGTDLPRVDYYIPYRSESLISRESKEAATDPVSQMHHDIWVRKTAESGRSIKRRNTSISKNLIVGGDFGLFEGYISEMAHFKHFSEQVREVNIIIKNKDLQKAIELEYGTALYNNILNAIQDISADGEAFNKRDIYADKFRSGWVTSTIGMSVSVMAKQFISACQFWNNMPISAYWHSLANPSQFLKDIATIKKSEYIKNRKIDRDLKEYTGSAEFKKLFVNPTLINWSTAMLRFGDSGAIALGGAAYYRYLIDSGMSEQNALREIGRVSERTQQSGNLEQLSTGQRGGSMAKLFTTYSTGPIQAVRKEMEAVQGMVRGQIGYSQGIKTLFIYHLLVPSMYSLAASYISAEEDEFMSEDWKDELMSSVLLGPLASSYNIGRTIYNKMRPFFGLDPHMSSAMFEEAVGTVFDIAYKIKEGDIGDITIDELAGAAQSITVATGKGLPVQRVSRMLQGVGEGSPKQAILAKKPEE